MPFYCIFCISAITKRQGQLADDARQLIYSLRQGTRKILTKVFKCLCLEPDTEILVR